ncbi:MAG: hypothetical protein SFY80_03285 [Verrucomicrobiota bacterium]|nr:hypothetical protein [Verrucomicrobiota bacterium]
MPNLQDPPPGLFVYRDQTHFDELDAQWILHHSRQIQHVERAQQKLFDTIMQTTAFDPVTYPDINVVVRKLEVEYLLPLKGVRPFAITLRILRLRECALTTAFAFHSEDGNECYTRGTRVVCKLSMKTGQPTGWTDTFRTRYSQWEQWGKCGVFE